MKVYSKDSIWQSPNGTWAYKNLAGVISRFESEKDAVRFKKVWKPHVSNLIREGVIKKGDIISLKLYGTPEPFQLELEGAKGKSVLFSIKGKTCSLTQIKQLVSKKLDKPASNISLNYNQTIHLPSGKSIVQLKRDFVSERREEISAEEEEIQSFDFLNALSSAEEDQTKAEEKLESSLVDFRSDLQKYEEGQFNLLSTLQTTSQEKMMNCYRGSLMLFLSKTGRLTEDEFKSL